MYFTFQIVLYFASLLPDPRDDLGGMDVARKVWISEWDVLIGSTPVNW